MSYVFISYAHADAAAVDWLAKVLADAGVPVWFDREPETGLTSGERWDRELRHRVDACAALIVVMSPAAAGRPWVRLEVGRALDRGRPVHPLLLEGEAFPELIAFNLQYERVRVGQVLSSGLIRTLRAAVGTAAPTGAAGGREVIGGWPGHHPHFVGRDDLLLDVETGLYWGSAVAVQALRGTGGVGKTQLAAEYVHRRRDDYDLVGWIDAEQPAFVPGQIAALAPALGVTVTDVPTTAVQVKRALSSTGLRWLLVLDNAGDPIGPGGEPTGLVDWVPRSGTGHIIITSRRSGWEALGSQVDVDVLTVAEAVSLLHRHVPAVDETIAAQIVEWLDRLPLAVEQAAAYLATTGTPPGDYLVLLRTRGEELLDKGHVLGYEHTVATVWDVSRSSLDDPGRPRWWPMKRPAPAEQLLRLCAFLGPEPIPLDLFTTHPELLPAPLSDAARDEIRFGDIVGALAQRSLVRRDPNAITVHRLLAAAVRRPLPTLVRLRAIWSVQDLLFQHVPKQTATTPEGWPAWRTLLPHVLASATHDSYRRGTRDRAPLLREMAATFLHATGQLAVAIPMYEAAVTDMQRLFGPDATGTLATRSKLAEAYADAGQFDRAVSLQEETVKVSERVFGPDHRDTLSMRNTLASTYSAGGHLDRAVPLLEGVVADLERVVGPHDGLTLPARNNLAGAYSRSGQNDRAILMYEDIIADMGRVLGPGHPHTLITRGNLARAYLDSKQLDRAVPLLQANITDAERALGRDHPQTLLARSDLASAREAAGQLDSAVPLHKAVLADMERALGPDHPFTGHARTRLADAYTAAGELQHVIRLREDALTNARHVLGPDHPAVVSCRVELANAYTVAGRLDVAIPHFEAALADELRILGPDHPDTLTSRSRVGRAYQAAGESGRAIPHLAAALADTQRILGPDHPDTFTARYTLANAYTATGQLGKAIPLYEAALTDALRLYGPDHSDTLICRSNVTGAYMAAGQPEMAIPHFETELAERTRLLGAEHPETLVSGNNLGIAYRKAGMADKAVALHEATLAEMTRVLGAEHPDTLACRSNLATAYQQAGQFTKAIPLHEASIADLTLVLGPDHPNTLSARNNLAAAYGSAGQLDRAIALFEATLTDKMRVHGAAHPETLAARNNLAHAHLAAGHRRRAIALFEANLAATPATLGADHSVVTNAQEGLRQARGRG
ncbi:FxSxx-COOH system tetratricopeptide repeat protein [Dactylosporangium sp. NPDC049525]|uniref:FxSxx-COOH system tetratricopeptide repeat protein n=1 Tax=Dactylosporangium sp. NPDC049525 TaxID=3154730 RepID=UPI003420E002